MNSSGPNTPSRTRPRSFRCSSEPWQLEVPSGKSPRLTLVTGGLVCTLGSLRGPRLPMVSVLRLLLFLASECGFRRDLTGPRFLDGVSLAPLPCFSEPKLDFPLSFCILLFFLPLPLSLSLLDVSFPFGSISFVVPPLQMTFCWTSATSAGSCPRYDLASSPPPARKVGLLSRRHSLGQERRLRVCVLLPRSSVNPSPPYLSVT